MRYFLLPLVLVMLLAGGRSEAPGEAEAGSNLTLSAKEWAAVKKLIPEYLWSTDEKRMKVVLKQWDDKKYSDAILSKVQFEELEQIIRHGSPFTTEKRKELTITVKRSDGSEAWSKVGVPPKYKHGAGGSYGVVVTMHGGPQQDETSARSIAGQQFGYWRGTAESMGCFTIAPAVVGSDWGAEEGNQIWNTIAELDRMYNVDHDRIMFTGHSWGGILTWTLGPPYANRIACMAPFVCAVDPGLDTLRNCRNVPIYSVQGSLDAPFIVADGRKRIEWLKSLGYEYIYQELKGSHEQFGGEIPKIAKWFQDRPRNMYARELVRTPAPANSSDLWYWLSTPSRRFTATIEKDNTIDLAFTGVAATVFLSDRMVDLSKEVTIRRGGETAWKGTVQRRLGFTLDHYRETGDRGRIFAASVEVK